MAKILILCRAYTSSVSSVVEKDIRALCKYDPSVQYVFREEERVSIQDIAACDSVVCVRGSEADTLRILKAAKALGKYLVYFLDDDLLNIPADIDEKIDHYFYFPTTRANLRACIGLCDALWSHNPMILQLYGELTAGKKVCTDMCFELQQPCEKESDTFNVLFAGSTTHQKMVDEYILPAVKRLSREFEREATFTFIGPQLNHRAKNIKNYPYFDHYDEYNRFLHAKPYHLGLAAVTDREFDRCKYFVKFFDYSNLGAAGLYSDAMPYTMVVQDGANGFLTKNTAEDWYRKIKYAITHREKCAQCAQRARKLIAERFNEQTTGKSLAEALPTLTEAHGRGPSKRQLNRVKNLYFPFDLLPLPAGSSASEKMTFYSKKAILLLKTSGPRAIPLICKKGWKKTMRYLTRKAKTLAWVRRQYGMRGAVKAVENKLFGRTLLYGIDSSAPPPFAQIDIDYSARGRALFLEQQTEFSREDLKEQADLMPYKPLFSIAMPLYNAPVKWLKEAVSSLQRQIYPHWELCAVDDGSPNKRAASFMRRAARRDARIRFRQNEKNGGISAAMNDCVRLASGEYIALMDQDDELTDDALYWMAKEVQEHPDADLVYSDECKKRAGGMQELFDFYIKPDWSPELLLSHMYTSHLSVYRKKFLIDLGGFRSEFDFAQDYDLALRTAAAGGKVRHVRRILYFWRALSTSGAAGGKNFARQACLRALQSYTDTFSRGAKILPLPHSNYPAIPVDRGQKVSIVIPSDNLRMLKSCIQNIIAKTNYRNLQIVPVTNSSVAEKLEEIKFDREVRVCRYDKPFNFSDKCNEGGRFADGDVLVFYNDDVTPFRRDWLTRLLEMLEIPGVGAVSPLLLQRDEQTIQYAGMIAGTPGICGTAFNGFAAALPEQNPFHHLLIRDVSVLSGACFAIRKNLFIETLFDAAHTPNGNSDVDFSFRLIEKGWRCVYNPYSVVVHIGNHSWEPKDRVDKSDIFMLRHWGDMLEEDPLFPDPLRKQMYEDFRFAYKIYAAPRGQGEGKDILFVTHELSLTGAPIALLELIQIARERGEHPVVIAPEDGPLRKILQERGIAVIIDRSCIDGFWLFRRFARNFDLVVANTLACGRAVSVLNGDLCPVLWWIHESRYAFESFRQILPATLKKNVHPYIAWDIIQDSLHTIYGKTPFPLFPCGITPPDVIPENTFAEQRKIFACIGSIEPRKGQLFLADAIGRLSDKEKRQCAVYFVGQNKDAAYYCRLIKETDALTKAGVTVRFFENLDKGKLYALYQKSFCIVVPSTDDPGPMIPVEAMSIQKMSIVSDACGASRCLHDGVNGIIFRSGDSYQLCEKIRWMLAHEDETEKIGRASFEVYQKFFSAEVFRKNAEEILEKRCRKN